MRLNILILLIFFPCASIAASIKIVLDTTQAENVIRAFEDGHIDPRNLDGMANSYPGKNLIRHTAMFDPRATDDQFRNSLTAAIVESPFEGDPFRYDRVRGNLDAIKQVLKSITGDPAAFQSAIEQIINPYVPEGMAIEVRVFLVVGGNSTGWTDANNEFFLDLNGIRGDLEGAKIMAAHEIYHVLQFLLSPRPSYKEDTANFNVEALLGNAVLEGTANYVADFDKATGDGALVKLNQRISRTNKRRMSDNFRLLDALIYQAANDDEFDLDAAYRIAYSGLFNEGGYYVGQRMAAMIERHRGRDELLFLQSRPPVEFFAAYIEISKHVKDVDVIPFGKVTEDIVNRLN